MSLGASEYSIGCAQNTQRYVNNLLRRCRQERENPRGVIADFAKSQAFDLFGSAPGRSQLQALAQKYARK